MTLAELRKQMREASEKATSGPWIVRRMHGGTPHFVAKTSPMYTIVTEEGSGSFPVSDAEFIALANPANIARLLDAMQKMEEALDKAEAALQLIAAPKRSDGTYNRDRQACEKLALKTLAELKQK